MGPPEVDPHRDATGYRHWLPSEAWHSSLVCERRDVEAGRAASGTIETLHWTPSIMHQRERIPAESVGGRLATAASAAVPPRRSISSPAVAATGTLVATMFLAVTGSRWDG